MKQVTNAVTTQTVNNYTARNKNKLKLNQSKTYWSTISTLNVEDKILNECHFIQCINNHQPCNNTFFKH